MPSFARAAADQDQYDEQARALGHRPAPNNKGYLPVRQQDRALTASRAEVNAAPVAEASVLSANTKRALVPLGALAVAVLTFAAQLMVLFETRYHFDWNAGQQGIYQEGGGEAFQHNLWASVGEMGKGGAGTLSFLVFALSGVLPYLTLALVVAVDWLGQGEAPASRAWKLLAVLSKWAFFEVWVVALAVLVVRLDVDHHQTLLNLGFWQEAFNLKIWTQAVALPGCYLLSLALVLGAALCHVAVRRAVKDAASSDAHGVPPQDASHPLWASAPLKSVRARSPPGLASSVVSAGCVVGLLGLLVGLVAPAVHAEFHFAVRLHKLITIENIDLGTQVRTYSVLGAATEVAAVNHVASANVGLSLLVFLLVVFAPVVRSGASLLLWFVPMRAGPQQLVASLVDLLGAFAGAEVFAGAGLACCAVGGGGGGSGGQLPLLFAHGLGGDTAQFGRLAAKAYAGLWCFGLAALVDAAASPAVYRRYVATVKSEKERLLRQSGAFGHDFAFPPGLSPAEPHAVATAVRVRAAAVATPFEEPDEDEEEGGEEGLKLSQRSPPDPAAAKAKGVRCGVVAAQAAAARRATEAAANAAGAEGAVGEAPARPKKTSSIFGGFSSLSGKKKKGAAEAAAAPLDFV